MSSKTFSIPNVGDILIVKHARSKKLSIKVRPGQAPKVVIPKLMPFRMGYRFAVEKKDWIIEHQTKVNAIRPKQALVTPNTPYRTKFHEIAINFAASSKILIKKENNKITLLFPEGALVESETNQAIIKKFIVEIIRKEAKEYLPKRLDLWAKKFGFTYEKVFVKNLKSRWGSCSSQNNINLNIHLMRLPEHLTDFILLHELCHTIHKNHGKDFHDLLNKLAGNEKQLNKELKNYSIYF